MKYDPEQCHRRSIRLQAYDYSQPGAYFITIVAHSRRCLFGEIVEGEMRLNQAGRMAAAVWKDLPSRFALVQIDEFVVMPNHIHGIIIISLGANLVFAQDLLSASNQGEHEVRPYDVLQVNWLPAGGNRPRGTLPGTIGRIVQAFKSITTHEYIAGVKEQGWEPFPGRLWQRNYYEHVIRSEEELTRARQYIIDNPAKWEMDRENPNR